MEIVNPATEEIIRVVDEDTPIGLESKFRSLRNAQAGWSARSVAERVDVIKNFATLLEGNREALAHTLTAEVGKPLRQSRNEIDGAVARIAWLAENASRYLSDEVMTVQHDMEERIRYEPLGVVCNISAWNYPFLVGVNVFVPALLAGNTVAYKPSEHATLTGLEIGKLLIRAGVPGDVFIAVIGGPATGEALLQLPFDGYFFTGSYKTGMALYEKVAAKMVPCQCELGGKDPLYVADDVFDIDLVAAATADGAFYNNGQSCCAVERIYVHEAIYEAYVAAFRETVASWKVGPPLGEDTYFGPLARKEQLAQLEEQVKDALDKGASLALGGKRSKGRGYFFEPTILTNVNHHMKVMQEESFGPVIGIMKVKNDEEALSLMRDTAYGLTAAVYSSVRQRAERILTQLDTGSGYWNCCDRVSAALPWSGRKHSGIGSTLSHAGLRAFARPKAFHLRKTLK